MWYADAMVLPQSVYIRELGPREGFQTITKQIPTSKKLELIEALSVTGVTEIEITSMVRPDKVPQMADAEEIICSFNRHDGVRYTSLYLNKRGFERAEAVGKGRLDNQAWLYFATSETFFKKNNNLTLAEALDAIPEWMKAFHDSGKMLHGIMLSTAFGCMYEGSTTPDKTERLLSAILGRLLSQGQGPREISLADTVGLANPGSVKDHVSVVRSLCPGVTVSLHLHDTRGTGLANVYSGLLEGVTVFDASVGGMGGCPFTEGAAGNVATEDVVYLCHSLGIHTGISLEAYVKAAQLAARIVGAPLPGKYYRSCTG